MRLNYSVTGAMVLAMAVMVLSPLPAAAQAPSGAKSISELDVTAVPSLDDEAIRAVQRALLERKIKPGPIDGIYGPRTAGAIRTFQKRYGMEPTSKMDNQLLLALGLPEVAINANR
jgi:peptidoglycan hydrolase-like protein with peptidoglycan-binding domain